MVFVSLSLFMCFSSFVKSRIIQMSKDILSIIVFHDKTEKISVQAQQLSIAQKTSSPRTHANGDANSPPYYANSKPLEG